VGEASVGGASACGGQSGATRRAKYGNETVDGGPAAPDASSGRRPTKGDGMSDVAELLGGRDVLALGQADVLAVRERNRRRRLLWLGTIGGVPAAFLWYRIL